MGPSGRSSPVARRVEREPLPQRSSRIAEMIAIVEAGPVPAVVARHRRHAHQLRHAIDVEQRHEQRIRERVRDGREPPMAQRADEESRVDHHSTPGGPPGFMRVMPSRAILLSSVVGLRPRRSAAPPTPRIRPLVLSRTAWMWLPSSAQRVMASGPRRSRRGADHQLTAGRDDHRAFDDVAQLADVAGQG